MLRTIKSIGMALGLMTVPAAALFFSSCQDKMKDYYEEPDWIKGSIYEILEAEGNYSTFLKGVDISGYTPILEGRAILTVLAPDDAAMSSYLQSNYATTDITSLPVDEVKKLIGYHILYYSLDKSKLENFRPTEGDGATEEEKTVNAGLYFKFRTRSQNAPEKVDANRLYVEGEGIVDTTGVTVDVYHLERFIPVFSHYMFETKLLDAKYNYEYFYPKTEWKGENGFNISNAIVTDYEVVTKNGYIYKVDRVIRPLETIHEELAKRSEYTTFLNMYDAYKYYEVNSEVTSNFGGGVTTYYSPNYNTSTLMLPNIASEWSTPNYLNLAELSRGGYTVFAPTNAAFDDFYREFWGEEGTGYPSEVNYDSIPDNAKIKLLSNMYYSSLVMPEEITKGDIKNNYTNTTIMFNVDEVPEYNRQICVNGAIYGQSVLTPVASFGSVSGPAYKYKKYNLLLQMLGRSSMESTLTLDNVGFIMLYPSDAQFNNQFTPIWWDANNNQVMSGEINSDLATTVNSTMQANYVYAHVVNFDGGAQQLPSSGIQVYRTISTTYKLYLYCKNGRVSNSVLYGDMLVNGAEEDSIYSNVKELKFRNGNWSNGYCYEYDTEDQKRVLSGAPNSSLEGGGYFLRMIFTRIAFESKYQGFARLMDLLGVYDSPTSPISFLSSSDDCIMLIPTTEAIKKAIVEGRCPFVTVPDGTSVDDENFWSLCQVDPDASDDDKIHYAMQYFLPEATSPVSEYPYLGWGIDTESEGGIPSANDPLVGQMVLTYIYDEGNKLTVRQKGANERIDFNGDYDYLPLGFEDGCVHFINDVLPFVWNIANTPE